MYIRSPVPPGPHFAYIFKDEAKPWFKLGISVYPNRRRKDECRKLYGRDSYKKISMYHKWRFEDFFAALYVEQVGIALLKRFGYKQVYENDWFEVNNDTIDVVIELIGKLARPIVAWESDNHGLKGDASQRNTPYGVFLRTARISKKEMLHRAYAAGAEDDY